MEKKTATKKSKPKKQVKAVKVIKKKMSIVRPSKDIGLDEETPEKTDSYKEHGCEYLNESECEEELEEDGLDVEEVEKEHFEEEKE